MYDLDVMILYTTAVRILYDPDLMGLHSLGLMTLCGPDVINLNFSHRDAKKRQMQVCLLVLFHTKLLQFFCKVCLWETQWIFHWFECRL